MGEPRKKKHVMTAFEKKLLSRVTAARERTEKIRTVEDLRPQVTIRRMKLELQPRTINGTEIRSIRQSLGASQHVFAMFIQVPVRTLQEWEQGRSKVPGCAARLISEMIDCPAYWKKRFQELVAAP